MGYKSKYEELMANALDRITNREKFSYDFNADPMYQMYKDNYTKLGNEAAQNAAANVSALTGGYGNSYAATAAAQANQQYLTKLNDQIPTLQQAALNKYMMEGDDLAKTYSTLADADARDYEKYRNEIADQQWQQNFNEQIRQWQASFDENNRRYNQEWAASQAAQAAAQALAAARASQQNTATTSASKTTSTTSSTAKNAATAAKANANVGTATKSNALSSTLSNLTTPSVYEGTSSGTGAKARQQAYNNAVNEVASIYKNAVNNTSAAASEKILMQAVNNAVKKGTIADTDEGVGTFIDKVLNKAK